MNPEAEEWVEKFWESRSENCEGCPFLKKWHERDGDWTECQILVNGEAEDCPEWLNQPEGEEDE